MTFFNWSKDEDEEEEEGLREDDKIKKERKRESNDKKSLIKLEIIKRVNFTVQKEKNLTCVYVNVGTLDGESG